MYKQVKTHSTAILGNGVEFNPIATLESEHGGRAHIWVDDHCYQLGLESSAESKSGEEVVTPAYTIPVTHIFPEAFEVLCTLPKLRMP